MRQGLRKRLVLTLSIGMLTMLIAVLAITRTGSTDVAMATPATSTPCASPAPRASATPQKPEGTPATNSPAPAKSAAPLESVRICIDPGHQRRRDSATEAVAPWSDTRKARTASGTQGVQSGVPEYEYTLLFSGELAQALRALGADVILTRESHDVTLSNIERAEIGNAFEADVVLRIHCDGSEDTTKHGIGLFVAEKADADGISKAYAQALLDCLVQSTGARSGGVRASDEYTGLNWSTVPAILVELGYMSNAEEDARLQTDAYRKQLIEGITRWCEAQFGERP